MKEGREGQSWEGVRLWVGVAALWKRRSIIHRRAGNTVRSSIAW